MGLMFTADAYNLLPNTYRQYCIDLWNESNSYTYDATDVFECTDGCCQFIYHCNDQALYDNLSNIHVVGSQIVEYSQEGCSDGVCEGHTATCCIGHSNLIVNITIRSVYDVENSLFSIDKHGNTVGTDLEISGTGEKYSWNGWTEDRKQMVIALCKQSSE